jgi:hypothetical protein
MFVFRIGDSRFVKNDKPAIRWTASIWILLVRPGPLDQTGSIRSMEPGGQEGARPVRRWRLRDMTRLHRPLNPALWATVAQSAVAQHSSPGAMSRQH